MKQTIIKDSIGREVTIYTDDINFENFVKAITRAAAAAFKVPVEFLLLEKPLDNR